MYFLVLNVHVHAYVWTDACVHAPSSSAAVCWTAWECRTCRAGERPRPCAPCSTPPGWGETVAATVCVVLVICTHNSWTCTPCTCVSPARAHGMSVWVLELGNSPKDTGSELPYKCRSRSRDLAPKYALHSGYAFVG